jgi:hypothetical protein
MMAQKKIHALTLGKITGILHDTSFEETMSEDQGHIDVAVCPPDADTLTDSNEALMISLGLLMSKMYQGHLKFITYPQKHAKIRIKLIHCLLQLIKYRRANHLRNVAYLMI